VLPARAARPRDQAQVAVGGQVVERWRLARLRPQPVFALTAGHAALTTLRAARNARPCKKLPGARQSLCAARDRPALRPLPAQPYDSAEWQRARVQIASPVEGDGHYDAVPSALITPPLAVRLRARGGHSSTRAPASRATNAPATQAATAPGQPTCRPRTGTRPSGRPSGWCAGRPTAARRWPRWSQRFWPRGPPPARVPGLLRAHAARQTLWGGAPRSSVAAGPHAGGLFL
jgi:hypothetical protein